MCVCVRAWVRACLRVCVRACVRVCVCELGTYNIFYLENFLISKNAY